MTYEQHSNENNFKIYDSTDCHDRGHDRRNLCTGTTFHSNRSGTDFTYQPCDLFFPVHSGNKKGTISYLIYLLIGLVGIPVFSGFTSGPGKLFGPTGGYLIGFIPLALIAGFFINHFRNKKVLCFLGMILGTAVCYALGTSWLAIQAHMGFQAALMAGVIPFLPGDFIKMILALLIAPQIRKQLDAAGLAR